MVAQPIEREGELSVSTLATIYGSSGLFDIHSDNALLSLSFEGQNKFLDWLGWEGTDEYLQRRSFITYSRPASNAGARTAGYVADPCTDGNGVEWGKAEFMLNGFARLRRVGPTREAPKNGMRYSAMQPRYRLDGTLIADDAEYDMRLAGEALVQDLKRMVIDGNKTTDGMFDGLERLVKTGYVDWTGQRVWSMDSIVIDMNATGMNAAAGRTWNGAAIGATYNFVDILLSAFRRVMDRIQLAPALATQSLNVGDIVFVAPTHVIRALLDQFTAWSVYPGTQYNEVNNQTYEARQFRNSLNGGMFGAGRIWLDGFEIPMMAYDWGLTKGPTLSDAYLLCNRLGSVRLIQGQFLDMNGTPDAYPDADYSVTDGGRILTWTSRDNTCVRRSIEMQPRLMMMAPWAQVRFQEIKLSGIPGGILSPDPWETSFFPESSFVPAGS